MNVASDEIASRIGVGNTPRIKVTIAAIQMTAEVKPEGIEMVTVSSSGSVKKIITITRI
jgi:hypothetical protein